MVDSAAKKRRDLLYGRPSQKRPVGRPSKYRPDFHPADAVAYFQAALDAVTAPERVETAGGGVRYVQAPVPPPTFAGYAASIGVSRETIWYWGREHEEFSNSVERCKAIQEQVFLQMLLLGAYAPSVMGLVMKNLLSWRDKVDLESTGTVTIVIDRQDSEA